MDEHLDFESLAPYQDKDVRPVLNELKKHQAFLDMLRFVDTEAPQEKLLQLIDGISTIRDFQHRVVKPWLQHFFRQTIDELTCSGLDTLEKGQTHLFISNHRDIILDSAILNLSLNDHNLPTAEIAIGDNLLKSSMVRAITRLNKIFTVVRDAPPREMYRHALRLSAYIRDRVAAKKSSIWLAQAEGRAKDGNDTTQQGLVKMLNLSNEGSFEEGFRPLRIRPMSLSYEYDPCDRFKLRELLAKAEGRKYDKKENEDYLNIETGIIEYKGRVHLCIQPELQDEIDGLADIANINDKATALAARIDRSIYRSYRLFDNNYIAYDLLHETNLWKEHYSKEKKEEFMAYVDKLCGGYPPMAREILLKKYAYPLINRQKAEREPPEAD
ncbi:MAG: 1-acyl-sn-glycerol-3-phosphate acyltransferase [Lewinellaceae bacterium]|nr:1-acyl-sn-glycerol-3-phosphate acyltransferase [Phaeodactylibacter sp.]MCB9040071.1 1-acyl-sn-glycerol-3-phosphate acyltransferase [Lewinellaceae bacterium]